MPLICQQDSASRSHTTAVMIRNGHGLYEGENFCHLLTGKPKWAEGLKKSPVMLCLILCFREP